MIGGYNRGGYLNDNKGIPLIISILHYLLASARLFFPYFFFHNRAKFSSLTHLYLTCVQHRTVLDRWHVTALGDP